MISISKQKCDTLTTFQFFMFYFLNILIKLINWNKLINVLKKPL